ncbi:putative leucine-rich repeat domain superfamily [Helianthus anomalus]
MISESYLHLESLNITRCVKITDGGLQHVMNLSDEVLFSLAKCKNIRTLNLTWCVRVTGAGVIAIGQGCTSLEFLR